MEVNIYIELSTRGVRALNASGMYLMEAMKDGKPVMKDGKPFVVYKRMDFEYTNTTKIAMKLLIDALERIQTKCKIKIYTENECIHYAFYNGWFFKWRNNHWKNAKNMEIKNVDMWKKIEYLLNKNDITDVISSMTGNTYYSWMQQKLKEPAAQAG